MNRRKFFRNLIVGVIAAPTIVKAALTAEPRDAMLVGFKGKQFMEAGCVYAPYIPLVVTSEVITAKPRKLKAKWTVEMEQDLEQWHGDRNGVMRKYRMYRDPTL